MEDNREEQIRQRAYSIWEEQGKPEGEDMHHWLQAWQELADAGADDAAVMPADQEGSAAAHASETPVGNGAAPAKVVRKTKP